MEEPGTGIKGSVNWNGGPFNEDEYKVVNVNNGIGYPGSQRRKLVPLTQKEKEERAARRRAFNNHYSKVAAQQMKRNQNLREEVAEEIRQAIIKDRKKRIANAQAAQKAKEQQTTLNAVYGETPFAAANAAANAEANAAYEAVYGKSEGGRRRRTRRKTRKNRHRRTRK